MLQGNANTLRDDYYFYYVYWAKHFLLTASIKFTSSDQIDVSSDSINKCIVYFLNEKYF